MLSVAKAGLASRKTRVYAARMNKALRLLPLLLAAACTTGNPVPPAMAAAPAADGATFGAMTTAADPRGAEAGLAMLRQGGNAIDAAAAMMLAMTVVEPQSSGIGGGGFLMYQAAGARNPDSFDGREKAPMAATDRLFMGADGKPMSGREAVPGGKSVGVPGNVAMVAMAHARHGKLPWAALFKPAIELARGGYEITPRMARSIASSAPRLALTPEATAIYLNADGTPKPAGTRIVNEALAQTLEAIASQGPKAFYTGRVAQSIVTRVTTAPMNPATMTLADLAGYEAKARIPVCGQYRSYKVCSMGPPSAGGTAVIAILKQLEGFDLGKLGAASPVSWHLFAESSRLAFADRATYGGDADFVEVPTAGLVSDEYLRARGGLIKAEARMAVAEAGTPRGALAFTPGPGGEVPSTTHFAAADGSGNVASWTSTVEGGFGSQMVASGMVLNNELTDFSFEPEKNGAPVANRVQGGKRPRSSMAPAIVYDARGQVVLAVGAAGGMTIPAQVAKAIIGVLDWKLSVSDAIALPLVYVNGDTLYAEGGEQGDMLKPIVPALEAMGHKVVVTPLGLKANGLERTAKGWRGGADPRSEGTSLGF
ncbi:gamma-glutamyltranspeptidase [Polymorphobacter multimanifer]|nr:gamma-glutamyltranspeptidase [Polymorphobacter multimanifer]